MVNLVFINPVLVCQKGDFLGSGSPYVPHMLAYTVGLVKKAGFKVKVVDGFGLDPFRIEKKEGDFYWQGISVSKIVFKVGRAKAVFVYASSITNFDFNVELVRSLKKEYKKMRIIVLANSQAVTSFDIGVVAKELLEAGVETIVYNNIEETVLALIENNFSYQGLKNVIYKSKSRLVTRPMSQELGQTKKLILPAWEEFPIKNYWKLGYSHGPVTGKFLPILTSYGCPYRCRFCVNPSINKSRWQAKKAELVVEEMNYLKKRFGVAEFHIEDLNPTVDKKRIQQICGLIVKQRLEVIWKLVSGTKAETLDEETLILMKRAGCVYVSISPETGSKRVLRLMNKTFDYDHADRIIKACNQLGIKIQACFVLGFPGERKSDLLKTRDYIKKITKLGVDEVAVFIASPLPGSQLFKKVKGYKNWSDLTFSPRWRKNYAMTRKVRLGWYQKFVFNKLLYQPIKVLKQVTNLVGGRFETKMEMLPYRIMRFNLLLLKNNEKKKGFWKSVGGDTGL